MTVALPVYGGWLAYHSDIFSQPLTIFLVILVCAVAVIWALLGFKQLFQIGLSKDDPHTEMILWLNQKEPYKFEHDTHGVPNIARFYSLRYEGQDANSNRFSFWDLAIAFDKPIGITTIRVYGLDGDKPNCKVEYEHPRLARLILTNVPNNKFRITFNEKASADSERGS